MRERRAEDAYKGRLRHAQDDGVKAALVCAVAGRAVQDHDADGERAGGLGAEGSCELADCVGAAVGEDVEEDAGVRVR